ncbi:7-carboxy-7-deazaguanine synthase QueE [Litoribrevibacter albus]|uniref:7-carboxy-7-deazaguanine synthase n=1 Tax=Litoribrevibacter albus TaxID=1473156 RepID=A0AA37SA32_9GAMM|nr:7-carboxy-7-deazaguanine synthase QueE [Litoribrevibacter albus]GLQ31239.1 7-carboxy-7-deazaguanine synthase [Litoribrevibacter albus]
MSQAAPSDAVHSESPKLRITEIFYSLQGETRTVGLPTVFVRLTGCPLRCQYCDTEYAFSGGEWMSLDEIVETISSYPTKHITVSGGEPLAQPNCIPLLARLCDLGYEVSLETSGAMDVSEVDVRVSKILDLKTPDSEECHRNLYDNIAALTPKDQVKFVICSRQDYDWSKMKVDQYSLLERVDDVLFSPSFHQISATELADWIVEDGIQVRMQLQLHKLLWNDEPGR